MPFAFEPILYSYPFQTLSSPGLISCSIMSNDAEAADVPPIETVPRAAAALVGAPAPRRGGTKFGQDGMDCLEKVTKTLPGTGKYDDSDDSDS